MHFSKIWDFLRSSTTMKHKSRRGTRLVVEVLEDRSVPSATASGVVSGTTFYDAANNGTFDAATDALLPGVQVTLTGTTTVQHTPVNATATTDAHGAFTFINVLPGAYHLQSGSSEGLIGGTTSVGVVTAPTGVTITLGAPAAGSGNVGRHDVLDLAQVGMGLFMTDTTLADFPSGDPGSGEASATFRPNSLPTVSSAIANVTSPQGGSTTIDLAGHFTDPDYTQTQATFHITAKGVAQTVKVDLFDTRAPQSVANFLSYVKSNAYVNSIFNRLVTGSFSILQGGGLTLDPTAATGLKLIPTDAPVANEYSASIPNSLGTLAEARTPDLNSGTDEFYFNLADNTAAFPNFTVFGRVADAASLQVLTGLASTQHDQPINNQSSSAAAHANPGVDLGNVPLIDYSGTNFGHDANASNFIVVNSVSIDNPIGQPAEALTYAAQVTPVTGPAGLVTAVVTNERLKLSYAPGQIGTATVIVTATDQFGATVSSQAFTVTVTAAPEVTSANVTLNGHTLSANAMATPLNLANVTFSYQWLQDGSAIPGATLSTLDLMHAPLGHVNLGDKFSVKVTPSDTNSITGATFTSSAVTITAISPTFVIS